MLRRDRRKAFTLVEALLATTLVSLGVTLAWDAWIVNARTQQRLDRECDALSELTTVCDLFARDAAAARAGSLIKGDRVLSLPSAAGDVRWAATPGGLERAAEGGPARRFPTLSVSQITLRNDGLRPIAVIALRGPGDAEDTLLARTLPMGGAR